MKQWIQILLFLIVGTNLNAQNNWKDFWKQSAPIKVWIARHPFKAKKAQLISLETKRVTDSIAKTNFLDGDKFGGQVDAFRHAYWMARLHQEIGKCASISLGRAYERSNRKDFRKSRRKDEYSSYDKPSKKMDLFNNKIGLMFTIRNGEFDKRVLIYSIVNSIKKGDLKILKKDLLSNYLTCKGVIIPKTELSLWKNNKCLVSSKNN